jgi:predicted RNA-binding Zn ribbon-like protein
MNYGGNTSLSAHPPLLVKFVLMETLNDVARMRRVGGDLALDFVNTRSGPPAGPADDDVLHDYADLVAWAGLVGVLTDAEMRRLRRRAREDVDAARAALRHALNLRELLDAVFRALATGGSPTTRQLSRLRDEASAAVAHARFVAHRGGFTLDWTGDTDLARPIWPVAHAATSLITGGPLDRVKACDGCRFLFLDESKNGSRRWCSMEDCGTAAKIRRYIDRRAAARKR